MPGVPAATKKRQFCEEMRFSSAPLRRVCAVQAVLFRLLRLSHACLFDAFRQKEAACGMLRSYSAQGLAVVCGGSGSILALVLGLRLSF